MYSRGVSQIVASVLVILIVLVATGMIWVIISAFLGQTSNIGEKADCVALQLQPVSCTYNSTNGWMAVNVYRDTGVSGLAKLNFIVSKDNNERLVIPQVSSLQELETQKYPFFVGQNLQPPIVDVGGISGGTTCGASGTPIQCGVGDVEAGGNGCNDGDSCTTDDGYAGIKKNCQQLDGSFTCFTEEKCGDLICNGPETLDSCPSDCKGNNPGWGSINNDCDALYVSDNTERGNLKINIDPDGQDFNVTRQNLDGTQTVLRKNGGVAFFDIGNSKAEVTYEVKPAAICGGSGVDIVYTIKNPKDYDVSMPTFLQVQGINQTVDKNKDGWYIYPSDFGGLILMKKNETTGEFKSAYLGRGNGEQDHIIYPASVYSPVIVTRDDNFAVGSSLMYPYFDYKHETMMTLIKNESDTWTHRYSGFNLFNGDVAKLAPGKSRKYTISLRFTRHDSDYFLFTLKPYKNYFNSLYDAGRTAPPKDLRPIMSTAQSSEEYNYTNPGNPTILRKYNWIYLDPNGKYDILNKGFIILFDELVEKANTNNFQRIMLRRTSGLYNNPGFNFPPQFMDFIPGPLADPKPFKNFSKAGIDLLILWGRSMEIPYSGLEEERHILTETEWSPTELVPAEHDNLEHLNFLKNQLRKAVCDRGASGIVLDHFVDMPPEDRYKWVEDMKDYARELKDQKGIECGTPDLLLIGEGAQPDFLHSRIGNFYYPCKHVFLTGPDLLSYYINPGSEIQVAYGNNRKEGPIICNYESLKLGGEYYAPHTFDEVKKHTQWGYTRLTGQNVNVTVLNNVKENECFDRKNNDGDKGVGGNDLIDFPFDPECTSFTDNDEGK